MMGCLNVTVFTFKNGGMWEHKNDVYCNFYGVQYGSSITFVFNDQNLIKKYVCFYSVFPYVFPMLSIVSGDNKPDNSDMLQCCSDTRKVS